MSPGRDSVMGGGAGAPTSAVTARARAFGSPLRGSMGRDSWDSARGVGSSAGVALSGGVGVSGRIGTSVSTAAGMRASRPRPSARLTTFDYLPRQVHVARRSGAVGVIDDHGLPEARRLAQANIARNDRPVDPFGEEAARLVEHLLRQVEPVVIHGEEHTFDLER